MVLLWLHARPISAQSGGGVGSEPVAEKVRLEYRGLEGCPDADAFRAAVAGRLTSGWEASPGELARRIDVVVSRVENGFVATIELLDAAGQRLRRAVRGHACGDVVNGIALVTALAIQSRIDEALDRSEPAQAAGSTASSTQSGAAVPTPGSNASAPAPAPAFLAAPAPVAAPASVAAPAPAPAPPAPAPPDHGAASDGASVPLRWRVSLRAGLGTGVAPSVAPGLAAAVMLERGRARFGLSLFGLTSGRVTESGVEARFDLVASRLEGCPIAFDLGGAIALEPCAFFEVGALSGRGYSDPPTVAEGQRGVSPWLAPGAVGRLLGSFGLLVVELEAGAAIPLLREEFYVETQSDGGSVSKTPVHEVAAVSFGAAVGVGVRF